MIRKRPITFSDFMCGLTLGLLCLIASPIFGPFLLLYGIYYIGHKLFLCIFGESNG